jgi:hypothetical protein
MTNTAAYAKAIVGAVVAALAVLATSLDNGELNAQECIYAAIAFFTALGAVWAIPNQPQS